MSEPQSRISDRVILWSTLILLLVVEAVPANVAGALPLGTARRAQAGIGVCTDSWRGGSGQWTSTEDWSAGTPNLDTVRVCITVPGSTVTVDNVDAQINSLIVGNATGAPDKLIIASSDKTESTIGTWKDSEIGHTGVVDIVSSTDPLTYSASFGSRNGSNLTNDGRINTSGALAWLGPDLLNQSDGTITLGARLNQDNCCRVTNRGNITLQPGATWDFGGSRFVQAAGTINNNGALDLGGGTFEMVGGRELHHPVDLEGTVLVDHAPPGPASFLLSAENTISGSIPAGQRVTLLSTPKTETGVDLASPGVTNDGTILVDATAAGQTDQLGESRLINHGTLDVEAVGTGAVISTVVTNGQGGKVSITGHGCQITNTFTNYGTMSLGQGAVAQLDAGPFTEGAAATLGMQIGPGAVHSGFVTPSNVAMSLAGTLRLATVGTAARGHRFILVRDGTTRLKGKFSKIMAPGATYAVTYSTGSVVLTAT